MLQMFFIWNETRQLGTFSRLMSLKKKLYTTIYKNDCILLATPIGKRQLKLVERFQHWMVIPAKNIENDID